MTPCRSAATSVALFALLALLASCARPNRLASSDEEKAPLDPDDSRDAVDPGLRGALGVVGGLGPCTVNGRWDGFPEPCDNGVAGVDGCDEDPIAGTCRVLAGWECQNAWDSPSTCTQIVCGDGIKASTEPCDDGFWNSDTHPDACRTNCRLPRCGDGVEDSNEICDQGTANGMPGACLANCSGYSDLALDPVDAPMHAYALSPAPVGTVGVLMSINLYEELCLPDPIDYVGFNELADWLDQQGFIVGKRVTLTEDTIFTKTLRVYDEGRDAYASDHVVHLDARYVEPVAGPVQGRAGDEVLVAIHGSALAPGCPCATGPTIAADWCGERAPSGGGGGTCPDGPYSRLGLCPFDVLQERMLETPPEVPTTAASRDPVGVQCNRSCLVAGTVGSCDPDGRTSQLPVPPVDAPAPCAVPGGSPKVDELCTQLSALNCPGFCDTPESTCGYLEDGAEPLDQKCHIMAAGGDVAQFEEDGSAGSCSVSGQLLDDLLADFANAPARDAWAYCTTNGADAKC